jgi:protein CpxP
MKEGSSMKHAHKHLIAAVLLALGLAASAQTPAPAAPGATPAPAAREHHGRYDPARMQERMAHRQAKLKQKLQITPAQESAWTAYTSAMQPAGKGFQRPQRGEMEKLTTPERIDRMRALQAARMAEMDKRAEATKAFYAALTPEQKKTFDALGARGHHRGGHRHHRA